MKEINQTLAQLYDKPMGIYDSIPSNLFSKDLLSKPEYETEIENYIHSKSSTLFCLWSF